MPTQLTASQLFQNAPSGVGPYGTIGGATVGVVPQTPGAGTWLSVMLQIASTVQLPTTSWQSGAPERTIFATEAVAFSLSDACISQMAQGGFLQSASSGTVTYVTPSGVQVTIPVTPDPSNPAQNPSGAPGYLDLLAANVYDVERLQASYTTGPLAIAKLSAGSLSYPINGYHVGNTFSGETYANPAPLTIPSSIIGGSGGVITGITPNFSSTIFTTAAPHGLTPGQTVYVTVPLSTGITGLVSVFAIVTATPTATTFYIGIGSSGVYSGSGAQAYLCTVATMTADAAGIASNAGPGSVTTAITQNANVFVSNAVAWSGSNFESNQALAARCQLSLAARSPNGPSQAYVYFAETAYQILMEATPPYTLTNGPVRAINFSTPLTGIVTTVVGSATPATTFLGQPVTPGVSQLPVTAITLGNPTTVTCTGPTGLLPGQSFTVTISGTLGANGAVNGTFLGTYASADAFTLPLDTLGFPAYTGGGSVEGGDLGQIDRLLQQNCVPDDNTALTVSALAQVIQITATVVVPQAYLQVYRAAVALQLVAQIDSYAIGGNAPDFEVTYNDIVGALEEAGVPALGQASYATVQSLSINSQAPGLGQPFTSNLYQAILVDPLITVVGI